MDDIYDQVVKAVGGAKKLADALDEQPATVSNWRQRGIPANRAKAIERMTGISVRLLRPHDWHAYWPDLQDAA
jgi:DNA-binding transcriptional regulator YdaS (Cro superfamily)